MGRWPGTAYPLPEPALAWHRTCFISQVISYPRILLAIGLLLLVQAPPLAALELDPWRIDYLQGTLADSSIFNGRPNLWDESQVARFTVGLGSETKIHCSGTLIARNVVLTAGHCVVQPGARILGRSWSEANLKVHFLRYSRAGAAPARHEIRSVSRIAVHPIWTAFTSGSKPGKPPGPLLSMEEKDKAPGIYERSAGFLAYDLALLVLHQDAPEGFSPASLPPRALPPEFQPRCRYFITGYGTDDSMSSVESGDIRMSRFGLVDHGNLSRGPYGVLLQGRLNVCHGDSGGPLLEVCPERVRVIALASHLNPVAGDTTCEERNPVSVHTYIWSSLGWILEQLIKVKREAGA